jgi:CheY-like chemotaxis protein
MSASPAPKLRVDESNPIGVLLVSPNSRLRLQLRDKLREPRWSLTEAASGAEALEYLHDNLSEILLLDPLLPDLESSEFSAMVREQFPSVQILTVNSHTGQLVLGTSSPTALSAQLTEVLYCVGNAQPRPRRSNYAARWQALTRGSAASGEWSETRKRCSRSMN